MEFGQSAADNLVREFQEETGLTARVGKLAFITEYIASPLHALELFYEVTVTNGRLATGTDPEMGMGKQQIQQVRFMVPSEIDALPPEAKHGLFGKVPSSGRIRELNGYFPI